MHRKRRSILFTMLFLMAFTLHAQVHKSAETLSNYSLGVEAYREGEFRRAFDAWSLGAYEGNAEAQYNLGVLYLEGRGVERNVEQARVWFLRAAEKNHVEAQYNLGHMSLSGMGEGKNVQEALQWWKLAAEGGYAQAQFNYGRALYLGVEGYDDKGSGLVLIRMAAEQKDKRAQEFLANNAGEIARLSEVENEARAAKKVVRADKPILKKRPASDMLPASEPGEIKLHIVRDQHPVQKNYLVRSADVTVIVYLQADLRVPIGQLAPGTLLKVTGIETNEVRIIPASGLPVVWVARRHLNFQSTSPGLKNADTDVFAQPGGDKIGVLPVETRIQVLEIKDNWVSLRVSGPEYGWISARNLTYSGESSQQLREAWEAQLQAIDRSEKEPVESRNVAVVKAEETTSPDQAKMFFSDSTGGIRAITSESSQFSEAQGKTHKQSDVSLNDNVWLFTQDEGTYVIHLFTLLDYNKALSVSRESRYQDLAHLYTTRAKQQQWAFLLLGPYADQTAAIAARRALPAQYAKRARVRQLSLIAKNRCAKRETLDAKQSKGLDAFCF